MRWPDALLIAATICVRHNQGRRVFNALVVAFEHEHAKPIGQDCSFIFRNEPNPIIKEIRIHPRMAHSHTGIPRGRREHQAASMYRTASRTSSIGKSYPLASSS